MPLKIQSLDITLDGTTYRASNILIVEKPSFSQRLILSLVRYFSQDGTPEYSDEVFLARVRALKTAFARRFPTAPPFREVSCVFANFSEWKYIFSHTEEKHVEWAAVAKECALIDAYLVDYLPVEE